MVVIERPVHPRQPPVPRGGLGGYAKLSGSFCSPLQHTSLRLHRIFNFHLLLLSGLRIKFQVIIFLAVVGIPECDSMLPSVSVRLSDKV
jgi:hypothetical protein